MGNYQLKTGSPAIDAGVNLSPDVVADIDGAAPPAADGLRHRVLRDAVSLCWEWILVGATLRLRRTPKRGHLEGQTWPA